MTDDVKIYITFHNVYKSKVSDSSDEGGDGQPQYHAILFVLRSLVYCGVSTVDIVPKDCPTTVKH